MRKVGSGFRKWQGVLVAAVVMGAVVSNLGCKKLLAKRDAGAGASTSSGGGTEQDDADEQLQEKLQPYISCMNTVAKAVTQARRSYFDSIPRTGPTGKELYAHMNPLPAGVTANCAAGVTRAKGLPPSDPKLEGAGQEFSSAANELDSLIGELSGYFDRRDYKDDKWAKGKSLHPRVVAAFSRFWKANSGMHEALEGVTKPLAQRTLARIEREEGKKFSYWRRRTLNAARDVIEAVDPDGEDEDIDFALLSATYTDLEKSIEGLTAYGSTHKSELADRKNAPSWPMADSNYETFVRQATQYKKAAKDFWRCLRDAPPKAKTPSGKIAIAQMGKCDADTAPKAAENVMKGYNEFIDASNRSPFP